MHSVRRLSGANNRHGSLSEEISDLGGGFSILLLGDMGIDVEGDLESRSVRVARSQSWDGARPGGKSSSKGCSSVTRASKHDR
jgi:hypothetical protein